jgi:hypothetical protein
MLRSLLQITTLQIRNAGQKAVKPIRGIRRYLRRRNMNPLFQKVERLLSTDPNSPPAGEVMVRLASGETVELHQYDTEIDDQDAVIEVSMSNGVMWINGDDIEAVWLHEQELPE